MSDVLVVQPDPAQADTLRDIFRRVAAELVLVHSTREAMDAIAFRMPDLILLSTLLSPRDEDVLMSHLRTLDGASHLQTLTIPLFRSAGEPAAAKKSGFSFRKKAKAAAPVGCDPAVFAEEVVAHLRRATEIRNRPAVLRPVASVPAPERVEQMYEPVAEPVEQLYEPVAERAYEPVYEPVTEPVFDSVLYVEDPIVEQAPIVIQTPIVEVALPEVSYLAPPIPIVHEDVDQIGRHTGTSANRLQIADGPPPEPPQVVEEDPFDFAAALDRARVEADRRAAELAQAQAHSDTIRDAAIAEARVAAEREAREAAAADLARVQAEAEAMREQAIAEARAAAEREAREAVAADLARVQAEAEAMREEAIAEARAAAEREAKETLHSELARVRSETEVTVAEALSKVKLEAEEAERARVDAERQRVEAQEAFAAELARVRAEVEQSLASQLEASRAEAERMRASEANATRERAAVEAQLKSELDRLKFVAAQVRKADESETKKAAEQIKQLERELGTVRAQAEERQVAQLEELRTQMAEMRESAAQHARAAAAEAVASGVARATGHSTDVRKVNVIRMLPRQPQPVAVPIPRVEPIEAPPEIRAEEAPAPRPGSGDYYSLWHPRPAGEEAALDGEETGGPRIDFRRHAKWALPVAACLLLVTNTGTAISTVARFVTPAEKPVRTVQPVEVEQFIEVVDKRVGSLKVESTPPGAEAIVDGRSYGPTPVTIPDLEIGTHMLVLKGAGGTIARKVNIKSNEIAVISEAIFSGWLAIFSPIPITVVIDGKSASLTDDGRLMTTPGKHVVELISERFNYRTTETLEVRPGATTAHTLSVPMGNLRVTAPEGAGIRIDGQPPTGVPAEGLAVPVGSHEITATHPTLGERRVAVDVMHGSLTEVTLQFEP